MDYGEQVSRRALSELPKGRFTLDEEQDSGLHYKVTVEITDDEFIVDLRDNPDQDPGSGNLCHDGSMISSQLAFKNVTDPFGAANGGSFRPLTLLTRPGSVFDASPPAAFGVYAETMIRLFDLIWRCIAPHLGDRLPAGHYASICGTFIGGRHPDTGRHFTVVEPQLGGWGASASRDGNSAMFTGMHGDTFNCPAEIAEARYGLFVEQLALSERRRRRGRAPRRQGHRPRLPRTLGRTVLHLRLYAQRPETVGARGRPRRRSQLRRDHSSGRLTRRNTGSRRRSS